MGYFTDTEYRLLLSAISREERICKKIDDDKVDDGNAKMLLPEIRNIERKIKQVQYHLSEAK